MKLRIKFRKIGTIRFIGHLDLMRFFQKMIRRAELDISYSNGYSPHQIMSFAAPLGVGIQSNGEYVDIEMNSIHDRSADIVKKLNQVSVPGLEILSVKKLPDDCKNAMASVAAASYYIQVREDKFPDIDYKEKLPHFINQSKIPYLKQSKKSEIQLDLKEGIYDFKIENQSIYMLLNASSSGNIKPSMIMSAFLKEFNMELPQNSISIFREDLFQLNDNSLVSMGEIGEEI